jgi:hypothetical protein
MAKKEPSNQELMESMNKRFNMVFAQFEKNDKQFGLLSSKLYEMHSTVEEIKENINEEL